MNDTELQRKLRALATPEPSDTARDRARHRALIAFAQGGPDPLPEQPPRAYGWILTGMAVLVFGLILLRPQPPVAAPGNATVLAQVEALFPGQLDAVIEDSDGDVQVAVAQRTQRPSDQPLLVEFRRGDAMVRVLSYSGRHVCVDLGDRHACFEAMIGKRGEVIVAGDDFVWTTQNHARAGGWHITAAPLGNAS